MAATLSDWGEYGEYRAFLLGLGGDNADTRKRLLRNLRTAVREELTPRQLQVVVMYYADGMSMTEIARSLGLSVSTVSRTLGRGRKRLRRCLRYGAKELLTES